MPCNNQFINDFKEKQALKIISGLNNFNKSDIIDIITAAELGKATYIDIAADTKIISLARSITALPLCTSSILPKQIYRSINSGIDIIEIGNFDSFYAKSMLFKSYDIKHLSYKIRKFAPHIKLCVTLPYIFSIKEQIELAKYLEYIGIDMIQTEGSINYRNNSKNQILPLTKSNLSLISTYSLSRTVTVPIIASSGFTLSTVAIAKSYGASCVGIKSTICNLKGIEKKINMIKALKRELRNNNEILSVNKY
uniref:Uncharacterized protein ycf23 n=1 Tax=Boldia erythrosiphon TaxID=74908 RepID=A0A1Y9TM03_9RHOD|nr:conserved hypothetical plastid protein [Boldia erythrosiphon]ARO90646.1 conserved hypothetical plastid protein [Boldia erythrosiphon]